MITFTKKFINPMALRPEDVCIEDIVHGLGNICRFGGQSPRFYSVAEHTLWVAGLVPAALRIHALMHDFAEAYLGDIIRPVKSNLFFIPQRDTGYHNIDTPTSYREIEKRMLDVIYEALGIQKPTDEEAYDVKQADGLMLRAELHFLFGKAGDELLEGDAMLPTTFSPVSHPGNTKSYDDDFMKLALLSTLSTTQNNKVWEDILLEKFNGYYNGRQD